MEKRADNETYDDVATWLAKGSERGRTGSIDRPIALRDLPAQLYPRKRRATFADFSVVFDK